MKKRNKVAFLHTSEVDQVIMDIPVIGMEQASGVELKQNFENLKKDKIESERKQAEEVRKKAMEKFGDTQKSACQTWYC